MRFRRYGLYLALAVGCGVLHSYAYVNSYTGQLTLSEIILQLSGSRGEIPLGFHFRELLGMSMRLLPFFLFQFYGGIQLYRQFCVGSVYVFSRTSNRSKWYWGEVWQLCKGLLVFQCAFLGMVLVVTTLRWQVEWSGGDWLILGVYVLVYSGWTLTMTLAVNLLALIWRSNVGYLVVFLAQVTWIASLSVCARMKERPEVLDSILLWNPVTRLVLGWQSGGAFGLEGVLPAEYGHVLTLSDSLLLVAFMTAAVVLLGLIVIQKKDILASNLETGGV